MNKLAIIGMGDMGSKYAKLIFEDESIGYKIVATTRCHGANFERVKDYMNDVLMYDSDEELFNAYDNHEFEVDTILVVTPHLRHKYSVIMGLKRGLNVLCDKPASAKLSDGVLMLSYQKDSKYGYIFHQRTYPIYKYLYEIIKNKKYGAVKRVNYIVTDWFRTNDYYKTSAWRAKYQTDGGGTIINQCPHSLDLLCHIFGLPDEVYASCAEGKYHDIEVEDDVTAYLKWDSGVTGVFIASTGEIPGINRMEITTTNAVITVYKNKIDIKYSDFPDTYYLNQEHKTFKMPEFREESICFDSNDAYKEVLKGFNEGNIVADGKEALDSLYLANAIYLSSWKNKMIRLYNISSPQEVEFEHEFDQEFSMK